MDEKPPLRHQTVKRVYPVVYQAFPAIAHNNRNISSDKRKPYAIGKLLRRIVAVDIKYPRIWVKRVNVFIKRYQLAVDAVGINCTLAFAHFVVGDNAECLIISDNSRSDKGHFRLVSAEVHADRNKLHTAVFFRDDKSVGAIGKLLKYQPLRNTAVTLYCTSVIHRFRIV